MKNKTFYTYLIISYLVILICFYFGMNYITDQIIQSSINNFGK